MSLKIGGWVIPVLLISSVVIVWALSGWYLYSAPDRGTFGDMFGAVNALFSGLAFAGLIYAVLLQRKELELQRRELELTRTELARTADAAQVQARHLDKQTKREDLYRLIHKLSDRINNNYNGNHLENGKSIHRMMSGTTNAEDDPQFAEFLSDARNKTTRTYRIVHHIEGDLLRLKSLIQEYELATDGGDNCTPFPDFYRTEYGELVNILHRHELIKGELFDYYINRYTTQR